MGRVVLKLVLDWACAVGMPWCVDSFRLWGLFERSISRLADAAADSLAMESFQHPKEEFSLIDEDALWSQRGDDRALQSGFQVNVFGTREHYLRLADAIRRFAEQDAAHDCDHYEHFKSLLTANGRVWLHVILRKDDAGEAQGGVGFPNP